MNSAFFTEETPNAPVLNRAAPVISIVIANFNYARYLNTAIESALSQTYPAVEVIVVDDGSSDNSAAIIQSYGERIIPILKQNGGQSSALNAGFGRATGEIICFLDADDALEPTALGEACKFFVSPDVVKVHWPLWIIGPEGRRTGRRKPGHNLQEGDLLSQVMRLGPDDPSWVPTSGNAWRREFLERVFPLPEPEKTTGVGSASADAYLSMLAPLFGTVRRVASPQGYYRVHGANDHSCMAFEKRLSRDVILFEERAAALLRYCRKLDVKADPDQWRENAWCYKLRRALDALDEDVPRDQTFLLVDDLTWDLPPSNSRKAIPFLEENGKYVGPPSDSAQAIKELERLRHDGARYIAFAWTSFWWLDVYPEFARHLKTRYRGVRATKDIVLYQL